MYRPDAQIRHSTLPLALIACATILLQGCATTQEVKTLVESSNRAIIGLVESANDEQLARLSGDVSLDTDGSTGSDWQRSVERIDQFIVANPQSREINNALRVRQASILMMARQLNLAEAVFAEVEPGIVLNPRDRAVYEARDALLLWYRLSGPGRRALDGADQAAIRRHLGDLASAVDDLDEALAVRRYLEQVRVRMALRLARSQTDARGLLDELQPALNRYGATFDDARDEVTAWHGDSLDGATAVRLLSSLRWYNFVPCAYADADQLRVEVCAVAEQLGEAPADCEQSLIPAWLQGISTQKCEN